MSNTVGLPFEALLFATLTGPYRERAADDVSARHPAGPRYHLDKRASVLQERATQLDPEELLTTKAAADWLGVSRQWLEVRRSKGFGPPFLRITSRMIRYRRGDVLAWLAERQHAATAEYMKKLTGTAE